jgi:hypothetical protein
MLPVFVNMPSFSRFPFILSDPLFTNSVPEAIVMLMVLIFARVTVVTLFVTVPVPLDKSIRFALKVNPPKVFAAPPVNCRMLNDSARLETACVPLVPANWNVLPA